MSDMKCYNEGCNNRIDFEATGSCYCSDACHDKAWAKTQSKGPVKYKISDGSLFARCKQLAVEAAEEKKKHPEKFGKNSTEIMLDELMSPLVGTSQFDKTAPLFQN